MDDGHINPDHPLLQQIDTLFRQLAQGRAIPTENDIKFADFIADALRLWAGIPIVPPEMLEDMTPLCVGTDPPILRRSLFHPYNDWQPT